MNNETRELFNKVREVNLFEATLLPDRDVLDHWGNPVS